MRRSIRCRWPYFLFAPNGLMVSGGSPNCNNNTSLTVGVAKKATQCAKRRRIFPWNAGADMELRLPVADPGPQSLVCLQTSVGRILTVAIQRSTYGEPTFSG